MSIEILPFLGLENFIRPMSTTRGSEKDEGF